MTTANQAAFRALHQADQPLLLPNAWDYASAAALAGAGFAAVGTTSLGVAAAAGVPDGHGSTRAETLALAKRLARLPVPITVDVEAGFSDDPAKVAELAAELAAAGVAGINLEDGRADATLADPDAQATLIRAIKDCTPDLFLNARTDIYWLSADPADRGLLATAIERCARYVAAGADGIFVPGIAAGDQIAELVTTIKAPVNVLYLPGRHTVQRLAEQGVRRISTGSLLYRASLDAVLRTALAVRAGTALPHDPPSYARIQQLIEGPPGLP